MALGKDVLQEKNASFRDRGDCIEEHILAALPKIYGEPAGPVRGNRTGFRRSMEAAGARLLGFLVVLLVCT